MPLWSLVYPNFLNISTLVPISFPLKWSNCAIAGISLETHQARETGIGGVGVGIVQRIDDEPTIRVMERYPSGRIDPAEANDHRKP